MMSNEPAFDFSYIEEDIAAKEKAAADEKAYIEAIKNFQPLNELLAYALLDGDYHLNFKIHRPTNKKDFSVKSNGFRLALMKGRKHLITIFGSVCPFEKGQFIYCSTISMGGELGEAYKSSTDYSTMNQNPWFSQVKSGKKNIPYLIKYIEWMIDNFTDKSLTPREALDRFNRKTDVERKSKEIRKE